jgi:hypothetical protein
MPLVKNTLDAALQEAFKQAMLEFIRVTRTSEGKDVSNSAVAAASDRFASLASTAIDTYIKSATIIVPPTVVANGTATVTSPPAIIS